MKPAQKLLSIHLCLLSFAILISSCTTKHTQPVAEAPEQTKPQLQSLPQIAKRLPSTHFAEGRKYAIATQGEATSKAAAEVLEAGGNLIDAAIAASFAISVERPQSTGIGGGGFMLFHHAATNKTYAFDFREMAPQRAFAEMFLNADGSLIENASTEGILASGVPGTVAGLYEIHRLFGKLEWAQLLEPAIRLATNGYKIYPHLAKALEEKADLLKESSAAKKIFFHKDGRHLQLGETLVQKDLARTLTEIQKNGRKGFYSGWVANAILDEFSKRGGLIERKDLESYEVKTRNPVFGDYKGYRIASMPPPSSGGVHVIQILNILENANLAQYGAGSPKSISLTASAMQQAFADRATYLGDTDFVDSPIKQLIAESYANQIFARISQKPYWPSSSVKAGKMANEPEHTTHLSFMDSEGNAISTTQTINGWFGSGIVVPKTGIVLNNEMDDFTTKVGASNMFGAIGGAPNRIEARKRPLSPMSPTIVFEENSNRPFLALGSPSGTRIINCVSLSILNRIEYKMSLEESQLSLRYHHQWMPDALYVEKPGFNKPIWSRLSLMGYDVQEKDLGCQIQAIEWTESKLVSASDPRGEGLAIAK